MRYTQALTTEILANLDAAIAKFTSGDLTWRWEATDTEIRYMAFVNDAANVLRLIARIPWASGPSHQYNASSFLWEEDVVISPAQMMTRQVALPPPSVATLAAMTSFAAVLDYMAAFIDVYAHA